MGAVRNISRRSFIKGIGLASGGLIIACNSNPFASEPKDLIEFNPNLFVQLNSDGSLVLVASRSEMGNGVRTSLTSVIADEMEADWKRVSIKQATGDAKYGDQNTDGSRSIRYLYETMRKMGATTRTMLEQAAAKKWEVSVEECSAKDHFVHHTSGKKISFGDLVEIAKTLEVPEEVTFKSKDKFKYIGSYLEGIDVPNYANGSAVFGLDKRVDNMKFVAIKRCPSTFGTAKTFDDSEALKIKGVEKVMQLDRVPRPFGALGGVAVVANNTWAAFQGKDALKVDWDLGANGSYDSDDYMELLTKNVHKKGTVAKESGNVNKAFRKATKIIESTFKAPHLAHAPMEVPNAIAVVNGDTCEVWAPTQDPQTARTEVAEFLGVEKENVTINITFLGGGFGRKSKPDYIVEAVAMAKQLNSPVQVIWSREDDIQQCYFHTVSSQYMKAGIDADGNVSGWLHRYAFPSIMSTFNPAADGPAGWENGSATNMPYLIPDMRVETGKAPAHVRIGWLRSVINIPHGFSVNVFIDELAHAAGKDPLDFRLNMIGTEDRIEGGEGDYKWNTKRFRHVLKQVAKNADWGKKLPEGHAQGIAVQYSFLSYVASVAEVSVKDGKVKVHKVHTVVDCGVAINKNTVESQMEGAAVFGMSLALYGKITAKDGAIEQSNFHDYQMVRMHEAPEIHVEIVDSDEKPTGVGEPGVPVIAPAIVNAVFKATGKRYHSLPLSDHNLV
ncbi:MAG: twin-arginine translocation pathway signal protein [Bacteroidetes bacterium MedPE-SWsnd-G1]|nr:MAG: twin-arginine translocation pathway signal protein [Bacteroidetes bacterium MedPE-SWsnd-G1]